MDKIEETRAISIHTMPVIIEGNGARQSVGSWAQVK